MNLKPVDGEIMVKIFGYVTENMGKPYELQKLKSFDIENPKTKEIETFSLNLENNGVRESLREAQLVEEALRLELAELDEDTSMAYHFRYRVLFRFVHHHDKWLTDVGLIKRDEATLFVSKFLMHLMATAETNSKWMITKTAIKKKFNSEREKWGI